MSEFLPEGMRGEGVPEWAEEYSAQLYDELVGVVERDMAARGIPYGLDLQAGVLSYTAPGLPTAEYELWMFADDCRWKERGAWAEHVKSTMDQVIRARSVDAITLEQLAADWSLAAGWLRPCFYPQWKVNERAADLVWWEVAPRLNAVLEYGLPHRYRPVPTGHARGWGRSQEELFQVALQNLRNGPKFPRSAFGVPDTGATDTYNAELLHYTASHLLILEDYLDPVPPEGVVVAVPKGSDLQVFRLTAGVDEAFLRIMARGVPEEYLESAGQVSPDLYWWRNGVITSLIDYSPKRPELRLPAELAAIVSAHAGRRGNL